MPDEQGWPSSNETEIDDELLAASAFLDDEGPPLDAPSATARRFMEDANRLRTRARGTGIAPIAEDHDLADTVRAMIVAEPPPSSRTEPRHRWAPVAAVAAAFVIGVGVAAAFLLDDDFTTEPLAAADFEAEVRRSLPAIDSLQAAVTMVERGAHPDLVERTYVGRMNYRASETLTLSLTETTDLPDGWPANNIEIVVNDDVAWRTRQLGCPVEELPRCLTDPVLDVLEGRAPFSAGWAAPLELVVPIEAIEGASIARTDESTITMLTTVARASTLLTTTIANGAFRQVHVDDSIEILLDASDRTLRGFSIRAGDTPARSLWAATWGYDDAAGTEIIHVQLIPEAENTVPPTRPDVPASQGGFVDGPVGIAGVAEAVPEGFRLHRSGVQSVTGTSATEISAWTDGRAWITVRARSTDVPSGPAGATVRTTTQGIALVDEAAHEVTVITEGRRITITGTLSIDDLVAVAERLPFRGVVPLDTATGVLFDTISIGDTALQVEQRPGHTLPPADRGDIVGVALRGTVGRFSPTLGELIWAENGTVIVVSGSSMLDELLAGAAQVVVP